MQYIVITRMSHKDLTEAVNAYISQKGWEPIGGVAITPEPERSSVGTWAQAMILRTDMGKSAKSEEPRRE